MVPLTGQNTINDMVDKINEVAQEIENVAVGNANGVQGPATSVANQLMAFADNTGKNAKAANISPFVYSILDDGDDAAVRATLGLKTAAVLDAATAATANTAVQRDASGNITGVGITATSGFVGNGSQITSLDMGNVASGILAVANGGTGTTTSTGTGSVVRSASPTFTGAPLSTTASADTNTTQIATTAFVIGQASSTSPAINGIAAVGTSLRYARADHVHPSDTSKVNTSLLGVANGVATLDSGGKVPASQLPAYVDDVLEYANQAAFPATGETGKIYVALDTNKTYRWSGSAYIYITSGAVDSVAGKTGVVTLVKGDVGLGNVDNTSDATKNIGGNAATATKLATARTINGVAFDGTANITVADSTKLPLTGGTMTGNLIIAPAGAAAIEVGRTDGVASTPYIDFHSGATVTDFDVRLIVDGGTGTAGQGSLEIKALSVKLPVAEATIANTQIVGEKIQALGSINGNQTVFPVNGAYITFTPSAATTIAMNTLYLAAEYSHTWTVEVTNGGSLITWPAGIKWPSGTIPTLSTTGVDILVFTKTPGGTRGALVMKDSK